MRLVSRHTSRRCGTSVDCVLHCCLHVYAVMYLDAAAATALMDQPNLTAEEIVRRSMKIAGDICVYTNHNLVVEKIEPPAPITGSGAVAPPATVSSVGPLASP